jgi:methionine aminopeptidase
MRILTTILQLALTATLSACDQQHTVSDVDTRLGHECFERHRDTLPPGTQYEGIKKLVGNRLTIKIMNGVEVVTIDCGLNTDGTIQDAAK